MTLTRDQLHDQLETARSEAEGWETLAASLSESLASVAYALAQACHAKGLCEPPGDHSLATVTQLIADLSEDDLVELLVTLPTDWADEITAADPAPVLED